MKAYALVLFLVACDSTRVHATKAPPIVHDKCVVDEFKGPVAVKQTCVYKGYNYACTDVDCKRTGEATGEQPKPTP